MVSANSPKSLPPATAEDLKQNTQNQLDMMKTGGEIEPGDCGTDTNRKITCVVFGSCGS